MENYTVGKSVQSWGGADVQVITFIVTEDCSDLRGRKENRPLKL